MPARAVAALSFAAHSDFPVGSSPLAAAVGDFNGDERADLAVADAGIGNVSVLLGNGTGSFGAAANYTVGTQPLSAIVSAPA